MAKIIPTDWQLYTRKGGVHGQVFVWDQQGAFPTPPPPPGNSKDVIYAGHGPGAGGFSQVVRIGL